LQPSYRIKLSAFNADKAVRYQSDQSFQPSNQMKLSASKADKAVRCQSDQASVLQIGSSCQLSKRTKLPAVKAEKITCGAVLQRDGWICMPTLRDHNATR